MSRKPPDASNVARPGASRRAPELLDSVPACLSSSPSNALSGEFGGPFKFTLGNKMTQLMRNAPQSRGGVREHTGREVNSPDREVGKGKRGPVSVKRTPRLQELLVLEDDKSHRLLGIWERTKLIG